ncbi:hypothetical protein BDV98DRAFT_578220 [Pterulicium gracile]|uniref:Uncharacterized protein n=1 Tax=Pterulicium gracile TaxID=1884261 RepID=A0A5C3Q438_9AGAR|nr:hypothetical protein BDV98DRAFT_578220 [Pterula gracilis]
MLSIAECIPLTCSETFRTSPWTLTLVCQKWRSVALGIGSILRSANLCSNLFVPSDYSDQMDYSTQDPDASNPNHFLRLRLQRSMGVPLDIVESWASHDYLHHYHRRLVELLTLHLSRCHRLTSTSKMLFRFVMSTALQRIFRAVDPEL